MSGPAPHSCGLRSFLNRVEAAQRWHVIHELEVCGPRAIAQREAKRFGLDISDELAKARIAEALHERRPRDA